MVDQPRTPLHYLLIHHPLPSSLPPNHPPSTPPHTPTNAPYPSSHETIRSARTPQARPPKRQTLVRGAQLRHDGRRTLRRLGTSPPHCLSHKSFSENESRADTPPGLALQQRQNSAAATTMSLDDRTSYFSWRFFRALHPSEATTSRTRAALPPGLSAFSAHGWRVGSVCDPLGEDRSDQLCYLPTSTDPSLLSSMTVEIY